MLQRPDQTRLPFVKMHGLGNDFVIVDSRGLAPRVTAALARRAGDRHRGVGFDQLAELHGNARDLRLDFWNADGTSSAACGNATRCVAARLMDETGADAVTLTTGRGPLHAVRAGGMVSVNMGPPVLEWRAIPLALAVDPDALPLAGAPAAVGMGNPHCVVFVADAEAVDPAVLGPALERDPLFPERTNVEFVSLTRDGAVRTRVWERGTGVTLACGSGACAVAVAANRRGLIGRQAEIRLDGGSLWTDWRADGVWLTGPVAHVFDGTLSAEMTADPAEAR